MVQKWNVSEYFSSQMHNYQAVDMNTDDHCFIYSETRMNAGIFKNNNGLKLLAKCFFLLKTGKNYANYLEC